MVVRVRSDRVIKSSNVRNQTLFQLFHRLKMPAVQFFFFQVFEKAFRWQNKLILKAKRHCSSTVAETEK